MAEGRQRRSERISALDTWRFTELTRASGAPRGRRGPSSSSSSSVPLATVRGRKRGRKKRRLKAVVEVVDCFPSSNRQAGSRSNDDDGNGGDEDDRLRCLERKEGCGKEEVKHVEGYYEIIKEPMDFATMRAKLQEGMYATLEQFERDVFLIFSNAMNFNSTSTIYYRQARAIQELAKKTLHRLKTDPENFVLDHVTRKTKFGDNLKEASRVAGNAKGQVESRSSDGSASTNKRQRNSVPDVTNEKPGLSSGRNHQPTFVVHGSSPPADCKRDRDEGVLGEDMKFLKNVYQITSFEVVRCEGKGIGRHFHPNGDALINTSWSFFRNSSDELACVNQGDFGYVESLAHFAAKLGPTALMVAQRKIERCKLVEAANAFASSTAATGLKVSWGNTRDTCTTSISDSATAMNIPADQAPWGRPGSAVHASVIGLPDSHIAVDRSLSLHSTTQPDSSRLLASRSEPPPFVTQSKLLEIVSGNGNACVSGNEGADRDARCLAYCHDKAPARPVLANCSSRTTLAAGPSQGFSSTRNGLWPQSQPPSLSQEYKQPAVIDMSFVQARLSGLSSCPDQQWRGPKPLEPHVEMPAPNTADAWKLAPRLRNQAGPPLQPTSDSHQPDLALQL
ncbi:Bromodomain and PHD finger-containing protein 3 [Nymphaea thermarum]|nr:Bromodomain and PHD finger-containing protein 3 [Nymphaea thermarum]